MEKARYKGYFFEASKDQGQFPDSPIKIINSTTDNLEDHHVSLDVYCGEDKLQRVEVFIRVTSDEKLEVIANKVEHWEYEGRPEGGNYDIHSEQIGIIDVPIPPLVVKNQLGDSAVDWKMDNVNERSK